MFEFAETLVTLCYMCRLLSRSVFMTRMSFSTDLTELTDSEVSGVTSPQDSGVGDEHNVILHLKIPPSQASSLSFESSKSALHATR